MFRKNLRTVKAGIIFGAVILSLFIAFLPTTSAGIINVPPIINITYPEQEEELIPNTGVLDIPISTTVRITGPWAKFVERFSLLKNAVLQIELKIVDIPNWCEANFSNPLAQIKIGESGPYLSTLTVAVNENAPAFEQGVIRISATSKIQRGLIFNIAEQTAEFDITFIIGYWCAVAYELPMGNIAEIEPFDTAHFQIDIKNLGNGDTLVNIELIDLPEKGWSANIASSVHLDSAVNDGEGASKSVNLMIKPKTNSDWKKEIKTFKVKFTPSYLGRPDLVGQPEVITFNVQKIGSLKEKEESDNNFLIILSVVIFLIIVISIFVKIKYLNK